MEFKRDMRIDSLLTFFNKTNFELILEMILPEISSKPTGVLVSNSTYQIASNSTDILYVGTDMNLSFVYLNLLQSSENKFRIPIYHLGD